MQMEWKRVTGAISGFCVCGDQTNRMMAFKKPNDPNPAWQSFVMCDDCYEGIKKTVGVRPAEG